MNKGGVGVFFKCKKLLMCYRALFGKPFQNNTGVKFAQIKIWVKCDLKKKSSNNQGLKMTFSFVKNLIKYGTILF